MKSNQDFVDTGEPFFVSGAWKGRCPLWVFRPGTFWQADGGGFEVVGESIDPQKDVDELKYILTCRRRGEVWGRWYSKHCRDGEDGFMNCRKLRQISAQDFFMMRAGIRKG